MYVFMCVHWCIFVYIFVHLCIFLYIRTYLQKMRRAICDKMKMFSTKIKMSLVFPNQSSMFPTQSSMLPTQSSISPTHFATNFSKFSKIVKCPKTAKIDFSWPLDFPVTPRSDQNLIFWWIFKNFKISWNWTPISGFDAELHKIEF